MKFMMLVKGAESQGPPPRALMEAIDRLAQEDPKDGMVRLDSGGLYPSAASTRVRVDGGRVVVIDGPFTEAKEVIGGYALFEAPSRDAALEGARRFMQLHADFWPGWTGETEVRQLFEPGEFKPGA
jgi:hypothetical protein